MHFQRGFKSLPVGSITQIFFIKVPKSLGPQQRGLVFKCNSIMLAKIKKIRADLSDNVKNAIRANI